MTTLKEFAKLAKSEVATDIKTGGGKATFEDNKQYLVEITGFELKTSQNGYHQAEVALSKVTSEGELKKAGRRWISLPVYNETIAETHDNEKLAQMRKISTENFLQFLRAAMPETFGAQSDARTVAAAVQGAADALVAGEFPADLVGTRINYVSIRGVKNPEKTYDGWFSADAPSSKYDLADA
jgi:hypothetical protein